MGQRHQIYVKMPGELGIGGLHHQWLYGATAVQSLARVLDFYLKQGEYGPLANDNCYGLKRQLEVVRSLYSIDQATGYWHYVHNLHEEEKDYAERGKEYSPPAEVVDPRMGDNNDGITIIDVSKGDFRYCFMSLGHIECATDTRDQVPAFEPLTAVQYFEAYYPPKKLKKLDKEFRNHTLAAIGLIEKKAKLLTKAEVKNLFPAMFKKGGDK